MVSALSDRWGVGLLPRDKTTWFEMRLAYPLERMELQSLAGPGRTPLKAHPECANAPHAHADQVLAVVPRQLASGLATSSLRRPMRSLRSVFRPLLSVVVCSIRGQASDPTTRLRGGTES